MCEVLGPPMNQNNQVSKLSASGDHCSLLWFWKSDDICFRQSVAINTTLQSITVLNLFNGTLSDLALGIANNTSPQLNVNEFPNTTISNLDEGRFTKSLPQIFSRFC